MRSLQALLIGGIEVDTPVGAEKVEVAAAGARFPLYASERALAQAQFTEKLPFLVYFDGSVRGLEHRCPGRVPRHHRGHGHQRQPRVRPRQPTRSGSRSPSTSSRNGIIPDVTQEELQRSNYRGMAALVERGLRAQLQTGNLLTGELFVDLTFAPGAAPAELDLSGPVPVIPSVPATLEALQASATAIMNKIAALPIEELMVSLSKTADGLERIVNAPELQRAAASLGPAINDLRQIIGQDRRRARRPCSAT